MSDYEVRRRGRGYVVIDWRKVEPARDDSMHNATVVFGPRRKADCAKFVADRKAIEADTSRSLRMMQDVLALVAADNVNVFPALDNHTAHAVVNHAAASRGEVPPYEFRYCVPWMTDPKDVTSEAAALSTLRTILVKASALLGAALPQVQTWSRYDCGHLPTLHGSQADTAHHKDDNGVKTEICYACADRLHVQSLDTETKTDGYLSMKRGGVPMDPRFPKASALSAEYSVTTWSGGFLMHVTRIKTTKRYGFHGIPYDDVTFNARDAKGRFWSGRGPGVGMYCRLRRIK